MPNYDRRTILKGVTASSAAVLGLGGAASTLAAPGDRGGPNGPPGNPNDDDNEDDNDGGGRGGGAAKNECTPPNELLAKFEWVEDEDEFIFEKPNENSGLVSIIEESIVLDEDDEPEAFCWESDVPVAFVQVKYGQEIQQIQGDVSSGCVNLKDAKFAISNVIFCVRPAQAVLCDVPTDGFDAVTHLAGDPETGGSRNGVVHVTSLNEPTKDYVSGTVNVAFKQPDLTLGDFRNGGDLSYDFFEGDENTNATPDEVFIILQTPTQRDNIHTDISEDAPDEFDVAYRTFNDDSAIKEWLSRNATDELNGDLPADEVATRNWKVNTIDSNDILVAGGIIGVAGGLRDSAPTFGDLVDNYPDGTHVLGIGYGFGFTTEEETLDAYFDGLDVLGTEYDFPVAIPLDVANSSTSEGSTTVEMELGSEEGVSAGDVVESSVRLTGPLRVAPAPPDNPGTQASSVSNSGKTITATFDTEPSGDFLVSGDFDIGRDQIVSFLAEGSIQ